MRDLSKNRGTFGALSIAWLAACSGASLEVATPDLPTPELQLSDAGINLSLRSPPPATTGDAFFACRLPAPVRSDDTCAADAECAASTPCHARACVGRANARPADATTICTRQMACDSVDANRCGCLEGRCSLIPPS